MSTSGILEVDWIEPLLARLRSRTPQEETNLFDLLTIGSAERVNSNMLAFYFDQGAHHGLGPLFIDALTDLVRGKATGDDELLAAVDRVGSTAYTVRTEAHAGGKRIDILLLGTDEEEKEERETNEGEWALIIENKLYADLYNDLGTYWNEVHAPYKVGVVLSLHPLEPRYAVRMQAGSMRYVNVLHKELIARVQERLPAYFLGSNDRHLLILKEYIRNIGSHYRQEAMSAEQEDALLALKAQANKVRQLETSIAELRAYVILSCVEALRPFGYAPSTNVRAAKAVLFWPDRELAEANGQSYVPYFRIWVNFTPMLFDRRIECVFELDKPYTQHGMELREWVEDQKLLDNTGMVIGDDGVAGGGYFHIAWLWDIVLPEDQPLQPAISALLLKTFFDPKNHFVQKCIAKMDQLTKQP